MAMISAAESYFVRRDTFHAAMVDAFMGGIYSAIFFTALYRIVSLRRVKSVPPFLMILMIVMYIFGMIHISIRWKDAKSAYVDHGGSLDSTLRIILTEEVPWMVLTHASCGAMMLIADCIMIWRCWALYAKSWLVIALPLMLLTGELVSLIGQIVFESRMSVVLGSPKNIAVQLLLACKSFTLATTVLVTGLIAYRMFRMDVARRFQSITAIIIESAALYSVMIIIYLPLLLTSKPRDMIPSAVLALIPGISSTLIIERVALGRTIEHWASTADDQITGGREVSTLRFFQPAVPRDQDIAETSTGLRDSTFHDSDTSSHNETIRGAMGDGQPGDWPESEHEKPKDSGVAGKERFVSSMGPRGVYDYH